MNRPAQIYRRGKPVQAASASDSDDDHQAEGADPRPDEPQQQKLVISIQPDSLAKDSPQPRNPQPSSSKTQIAEPTESDDSSSSTASSDDQQTSDDDDDDDESSSEEEKLVPIYKPVFISKKNRQTDPIASNPNQPQLDDVGLEAQKKLEEENVRRKLSSQKLVEQTLMRELAEKDVGQVFPDVDDTDGLDPEAEFESWKLRELTRLKRDREALLQRTKEKEEIEARRALPESQRLKEDLEFAKQTRQAKPKTKQVFLQKYHHKGAFYNDAEILKKHDYTAPTEGTFTKMELLPSVMQVRDFGKMSRSKWTHLAKEDTTSFDAGWYQKSKDGKKGPPAGCFKCGQMGHIQKDCKSVGGEGANKVELGTRKEEERSKEPKKRREDSNHDVYPSKRREGSDHRRSDRSPPPRPRDAPEGHHRYRQTYNDSHSPNRRLGARYDDNRSTRRDRSRSSIRRNRTRSPIRRERSRSPQRHHRD